MLAVRISGLPGDTIDAVARIAYTLRHHGACQHGKRDDGGANQSKSRHAFLPCVRGREDHLISAKPTQTACEPAHIKKNSWHNGSRRGYGRGFRSRATTACRESCLASGWGSSTALSRARTAPQTDATFARPLMFFECVKLPQRDLILLVPVFLCEIGPHIVDKGAGHSGREIERLTGHHRQ